MSKGITKSYFFSMDSVEFKVQLAPFAVYKCHLKKKVAMQTLKIVLRYLRNSKAQNQDPWKFHIIFSSSPLEVPLHF